MAKWKKDFERLNNLKADFAPNDFEQKMFKSGWDACHVDLCEKNKKLYDYLDTLVDLGIINQESINLLKEVR